MEDLLEKNKGGWAMKRVTICYVATTIMLVCVFVLSEAQAVSPPQKGGAFPDIALSIPRDAGERQYLGLPETGKFKIPHINAKVVLIEVFNMY